MKTIMVAALLCTTTRDASPVSFAPTSTPEDPEALAPRRAPDEGLVHFPGDRSAQTLVLRSIRWDRRRAMQTHVPLARNTQVFRLFSVPLRRTKDCAQDDNRVLGRAIP